MFEKASRIPLRFPFTRGLISVEDLWNLTLTELDSIFKTLNRQVKAATEESLLDVKSKAESEISLKIDIIKHIVEVKKEESAKERSSKALAEEEQFLLGVLAKKQVNATEAMTEDQIKTRLAEIQAKK